MDKGTFHRIEWYRPTSARPPCHEGDIPPLWVISSTDPLT